MSQSTQVVIGWLNPGLMSLAISTIGIGGMSHRALSIATLSYNSIQAGLRAFRDDAQTGESSSGSGSDTTAASSSSGADGGAGPSAATGSASGAAPGPPPAQEGCRLVGQAIYPVAVTAFMPKSGRCSAGHHELRTIERMYHALALADES